MFQSVQLFSIGAGVGIILIVDDNFVTYRTIDIRGPKSNIMFEAAIILEYAARKLNVAQALSQHYINKYQRYKMHENYMRIHDGPLNGRLVLDRTCLDAEFPELQYGDKYFSCVIRQLKRTLYGYKNGKKDIQ